MSETKKMKKSIVLVGLDCGTQSTKLVLYDPQIHKIVGRSSATYELDENKTNQSGRAEQHPIKWIKALHKVFSDISSILNDENNYVIGSIGVSGQQHGMVPLDDKFQVVRSAKLWCDIEASDQAVEFSTKTTEWVKSQKNDDISGGYSDLEEFMSPSWDIPAGFTAPKVLWMKQREPDLWKKVRWVILPHDYINLCLRTGIGSKYDQDTNPELVQPTGTDPTTIIPTTDAGDASGTGLLHPKTRSYIPEIAELIGTKYKLGLPKILPSNAVSGHLSDEWKKIIDPNDKYPPIPISVGSGDNMMSALGCQCTSPGMAVLSLGTSGTIFGVSDSPVKMGTPVAPFCDATGQYLPLVCIMSCTSVLNAVLENWCSDRKNNNSFMTHEEATKLAQAEEPGCHGITFLPYLGGERTPNWPHATGALLGLTPANMNCMSGGSPGIIYRAAMEGITYLLAHAMDQISSASSGFKPKSLLVVGGGSKNSFWRQMLADVLQLELRFPKEPESAALGAAFQAGAAMNGMGVKEYVEMQRVEMEDTVVVPTTDELIRSKYCDGLERYRKFSSRLFSEE